MRLTLVRSRDEALLGGVCGGLGAFLDINPVYVRVFFVLLAFGSGVGALLYLLLWLILPLDGQVRATSLAQNVQEGSQEILMQARSAEDDLWRMIFGSQARLSLWIGAVLILVGLIYLLPNLNLHEPAWLNFDVIWPILLFLGGLVLLLRRPKGAKSNGRTKPT